MVFLMQPSAMLGLLISGWNFFHSYFFLKTGNLMATIKIPKTFKSTSLNNLE